MVMIGFNRLRGVRDTKKGHGTAGKPAEVAAGRRWFLTSAGVAAGGALLPTSRPAEAAAPAADKRALYRETEHIRRYYELAR
jgi:hypothetical protein